jgi:hypothetical protein
MDYNSEPLPAGLIDRGGGGVDSWMSLPHEVSLERGWELMVCSPVFPEIHSEPDILYFFKVIVYSIICMNTNIMLSNIF